MRRTVILAASAFLCTIGAAPSFADWESLGSLGFSQWDNHNSTSADIRGDSLALTARGSDMYCRNISATFGNGRTRQIFSGDLQRGQTVNVDLPGRERNVDTLNFDCRPQDGLRGRVQIAANTSDRYYGYNNYYDRDENRPNDGFFGQLFGDR